LNTDRWLVRFKREALPKLIAELKPEKILLFGSRIKGTADENSDIDVIVVSNAFATIPFIEQSKQRSSLRNTDTDTVQKGDTEKSLGRN
jgi:predicted nucleotidyltransferase